jgi:acetoacetyl-CoA synthetase
VKPVGLTDDQDNYRCISPLCRGHSRASIPAKAFASRFSWVSRGTLLTELATRHTWDNMHALQVAQLPIFCDVQTYNATEPLSMPAILFQPTSQQASTTKLAHFKSFLAESCGTDFQTYRELHAWSVNRREIFWSEFWKFGKIIGEPGTQTLSVGETMIRDRWFPNGKLNFAENLLRPELLHAAETAELPAIIAVNEQGLVRTWSRSELHEAVVRLANYLEAIGIRAGDRIAAVLPNCAEAIVGMMATTAIGAVWSSCSPDFGNDAICDRFSQIEPRLLLTTEACQYNGKPLSPLTRVLQLVDRLPTLEQILFATSGESGLATPDTEASKNQSNVICLNPILSEGPAERKFERFAFNHPAFILYSSGTTGKPKCIVHSAGGTLIQHMKEHQLHCDLREGDVAFYYTTTGWMMWNWLVSALASSAAILVYDGNPLVPREDILFELADRYKVTHFGTSAKFLSALKKRNCQPIQQHDCDSLRVIMSTGSPLMPDGFDYVYGSIKSDVHLASISGGTDIISCFVLGSPVDPVYRGEIQFAGLAMDVQVVDDNGMRLWDQAGELVCKQSFPSMPTGFWDDPEDRKYLASYFERFENVWCHGDWAMQNSETLGWVIYGRSDATLNPGGVRIGTAEIYQQVEAFSEIAEALATAVRKDGDEEVVLFVRMQPNRVLDPDVVSRIRHQLRTRLSPRHVPQWIVQVPDFPRTISGKLSEIAVRHCLHGLPIQNASALSNPESLQFFASWEPQSS